MKISIKNFEKNISKAFLTTGKNYFDTNKVREFDEESIGNFVAFVDDGTESYDVNIVLDDKQNITKHSCDCKEEYLYCAHQIAVLYQLQLGAKASAVKIPKAKKKTPSELLLETLSQEAIITFLSEAFANDKILELKFVQHFSSAKVTLEEAQKNIDTSRKTVVKAKKKIEKAELTQIINLCNPILYNFIKQTDADLQIDAIKDVIALISYYETMLLTFNINSNLPEKTIQKISLEKYLFIDKAQNIALKESIKLLTIKSIFIESSYSLNQIKTLVTYLSDLPSDEVFLILTLLKLEMRKISTSIKDFSQLQDKLLPIVIEKQILAKLKNEFTTLHFDNAHNKLLIDGLIAIEDYTLAETYCIQIINTNYNEHYNIYYYKKLVTIYEKQNNDAKKLTYQIKVCEQLPTYEDYTFIISQLKSEEEKKDFLKKTLNALLRSIHNLTYESTYLKIQIEEEKFTSVFNRLESTKTLLHCVENFAILFKNNPKRLLQILLSRQKAYQWNIEQDEHRDENYYNAICKLIKENYSAGKFQEMYIDWMKRKTITELGIKIRDYMIKS
jgi:hypothetical protein